MTDSTTVEPLRPFAGVPPTDIVLPKAELSIWLQTLRLPENLCSNEEKKTAMEGLLAAVKKDEMLPFYLSLCQEFNLEKDSDLINVLVAANAEEDAALTAALADNEQNFGDMEVKDCLLAKANFLCRIGDIDAAVEAYEVAHQKTVGSGSRLDIVLTLVRIGLLFNKPQVTKKNLALAKIDCDKGGDWERRNKLKIYEAVFLAQHRKFSEGLRIDIHQSPLQAAELLRSCVAIFTASELISFETFIFMTVILCTATFERPALKSNIIPSPEIAQVLEEDAVLKLFVHAFFHCRYAEFMSALVEITPRLQRNPYLMQHSRYLLRCLRLKGYKQFLEPFSSVTIASMAQAFGVSEDFIESDVTDFISNGKLSCKVNRVQRVIVCARSVPTETLFQKAIKDGDLLLGNIQKLSKIIDV